VLETADDEAVPVVEPLLLVSCETVEGTVPSVKDAPQVDDREEKAEVAVLLAVEEEAMKG
jgi:hypothetical protein